MWLMELMWVVVIILLLGFSVKVNDQVLRGINFKQEVMLLYSQLAEHRLYQRYGGGYYDLYSAKSMSHYVIKKGKYRDPYRTYVQEDFTGKAKLIVDSYRGLNRKGFNEDYAPGTLGIVYPGAKGKKLEAWITVNRVGALRSTRSSWRK